MNRIDKVRRFRNRINANLQAARKLVKVDELAPEELTEMIDLYPSYDIDTNYSDRGRW